MPDYTRIPLEVLRAFAATQSRLTSMRQCADAAGIRRSTFHKFVTAGTMPHPRIRRLPGLWYLRGEGQAEDIDVVRPYVARLDTLVADLETEERQSVQREVIFSLVRTYDMRMDRPAGLNCWPGSRGSPGSPTQARSPRPSSRRKRTRD
jgi:hypothetical protein